MVIGRHKWLAMCSPKIFGLAADANALTRAVPFFCGHRVLGAAEPQPMGGIKKALAQV
jgi:hypothetical protein